MSFVSRLQLTNFRNYESLRLGNLSDGIIVLCGANGAGKTNLLEALSLLSPGRGLRGAKLSEMQRISSSAVSALAKSQGHDKTGISWAISSIIKSPQTEVRIGTGFDPATEKRLVRINGETMRGQNALGEYLSCVWLTPRMDRIFLDSAGGRRRFLDRLVFAFDPGHSGRVSRYENALGRRSKLLREGRRDPKWLSALEAQIAETGVAVAAARLDYIDRLRHACAFVSNDENRYFPRAGVSIAGFVEENLTRIPALDTEELFRSNLEKSRTTDAVTGGAETGPHRSDLEVACSDTGMPAAQCSTGEQKALLTGIIIAHSRLVKADRGDTPMLLLDEVAAHLDEKRRAALFNILQEMKCQVWLTGTDESLFSEIKDDGKFLAVHNSKIIPFDG